MILFFKCIKISKHLSAKYNRENKERLEKNLVKDIKIFLKKKKKKSNNMVGKLRKPLRSRKTKACLV